MQHFRDRKPDACPRSQGWGHTDSGFTPRPAPVCQPLARCPSNSGSRWEHPWAASWGPKAASLAALSPCWEPPDQTLTVQGFSSPGSPAPGPAQVLPAVVVGQTGASCQAGCETQWSQDSRAKNTNYIRLPGEGRSSCRDCSLVHLKPRRRKDGSILSRKTQGPPGKQTWIWWLQPQTPVSSGREGITVPWIRAVLPRRQVPGSKGQLSQRHASRATFWGVLLRWGFRPRPSWGASPAPPLSWSPRLPQGDSERETAVSEAAPPPGGCTGCLPAPEPQTPEPGSLPRPRQSTYRCRAGSRHTPHRGDQEKQEQE